MAKAVWHWPGTTDEKEQASSMADEVAAAQQRGRQQLEVALARK